MAQVGYSEKLAHDVQESERNDSPPPGPQQTPRKFWEKLGVYNLAILVIGTLAIALALAFLLFIWAAATHARHTGVFPFFWFLIVDAGWASKVMTLSSVVLRVATAAQLGVFAAIMAALILEKVGVETENLPTVSMIRCLNSGPHSLAMSVFNSIFTRALFPYSFLILLALLDGFVLQFTSTVLLLDFENDLVVTSYVTTNITYALHNSDTIGVQPNEPNPWGAIDYWKNSPASYNRLAEYSEAGLKGANFVDTGKTYRGFLPFRDSLDRGRLRNYTGPMTVVDARVVCVKPTLANISFAYDEDNDLANPSIKALVTSKDSHPDIIANEAIDMIAGGKINCSIPSSDYFLNKPYWTVSLCDLGSAHQARLINGIKPDPKINLTTGNMGQTSMHLFINATGTHEDWNNIINGGGQTRQLESSQSIWTTFRGGNTTLQMSLCYFNPQPSDYNVTAWAEADSLDADLDWNATAIDYDSTLVQKLFGATKETLTLEQRGLMRLQPEKNWTAVQMDQKHDKGTDFIWETLTRWNAPTGSETEFPGDTSMFTENGLPRESVHRTHTAIFQHIFQQTENPALALQAIWTILLQMAYYDFYPQYDMVAPAEHRMSSILLVPVRWWAFGAVLCVLAVHAVLVLTAVILFLLKTELSLLGNAWQAVSQVLSTDTAGVVHHGATATDGEVKGSMKKSGAVVAKVRIAQSASSGRPEATAIRQRHGVPQTTEDDKV